MDSQPNDPYSNPSPSPPNPNPTLDPNAFNLALVVALLRSQKRKDQSQPPGDDPLRWKEKAKKRKRELISLREELKLLEDERIGSDPAAIAQQIVSCRCHFFEECGQLRRDYCEADTGHWIDDALRRRFLRHVRWNERRKKACGSARRGRLVELDDENDVVQLSTSADFLVELADTPDKSITSFASLSHLAIDFILAATKSFMSAEKDHELVEEIINGLIRRLTERMCSYPVDDDTSIDSDYQISVQHLIRKLANEAYIGQRIMLLVSQRMCALADNFLMMDPFNDTFPDMHDSMFMMMQLIEFLISDNMHIWMNREDIDNRLLEEWLRSILQVRKSCKLLECRYGLYIIYIERIAGQLAKCLAPLSRRGKIDEDILSRLFCAL